MMFKQMEQTFICSFRLCHILEEKALRIRNWKVVTKTQRLKEGISALNILRIKVFLVDTQSERISWKEQSHSNRLEEPTFIRYGEFAKSFLR